MSEVEQLELRIENLSPQDLAKSGLFVEVDARGWDDQIEAGAKAGRLDDLIAEALANYRAGKARKL